MTMNDKKSNENHNSEYFYFDGKQTLGPYKLNDFPISKLSRNTLVWKTGMTEWQEAQNFSELGLMPPPIEAIAPNGIIMIGDKHKHNDYSNSTVCWFCGTEPSTPYSVELTKYKRKLGQIGSTKYHKTVKVNMCHKCREGFDNRQILKRKVYFIVLILVIIASTVYCLIEPEFASKTLVERFFMGPIVGFLFGIFPAWGISSLITNNPIHNTKLRNSLNMHPEIIAAHKEGYSI